jgi:hypothetical protein
VKKNTGLERAIEEMSLLLQTFLPAVILSWLADHQSAMAQPYPPPPPGPPPPGPPQPGAAYEQVGGGPSKYGDADNSQMSLGGGYVSSGAK